ncbi:MAG: alpha/beta fold hydrolase [Mycobacteriales bacterium]
MKPQVRTVSAGRTSFLLREQVSDGAGTPVLLLHGVPETASCWGDLAPRLATGRRVLAPDLPGLGGSTYSGPYDVASLVAQLAGLIETEVPGGRVDVVGHDWGGVLALGLVGARPDLVRRLVVANAPYRELPLRALHIPFLALPVVPELLFRFGGRQVVDAVFSLAWRAATPPDPDRLAEYRAAYTRPSVVEAMLGYYRAVARPRLAALVRPGAAPVPVPRVRVEKALVLWGALDPVMPVSSGESVVRDLGADCVMVTVPGAGHFVVEEAPDVVAQVLLDFLADEQTPPPPVPAAPPEKEHGPVEPPPGVLTDPAPDVPVKKAPAKKTPAKKTPAKKTPAKPAPAKKTPAKPVPADVVPAPDDERPPPTGAG